MIRYLSILFVLLPFYGLPQNIVPQQLVDKQQNMKSIKKYISIGNTDSIKISEIYFYNSHGSCTKKEMYSNDYPGQYCMNSYLLYYNEKEVLEKMLVAEYAKKNLNDSSLPDSTITLIETDSSIYYYNSDGLNDSIYGTLKDGGCATNIRYNSEKIVSEMISTCFSFGRLNTAHEFYFYDNKKRLIKEISLTKKNDERINIFPSTTDTNKRFFTYDDYNNITSDSLYTYSNNRISVIKYNYTYKNNIVNKVIIEYNNGNACETIIGSIDIVYNKKKKPLKISASLPEYTCNNYRHPQMKEVYIFEW